MPKYLRNCNDKKVSKITALLVLLSAALWVPNGAALPVLFGAAPLVLVVAAL